ncbi:hypothetical protein Ae717Ps2_6758 [Pseudonocardia sp. Ae717_Ps2]|nr:hypothetical protein Ae717Ps2_6972c [Pseudonocardia sp. Ae717_Ps2]OLM28130.1 hypothetical protein Ae717Ps2_6758 [Pseudonocardia sp. Ae717_Ps2]
MVPMSSTSIGSPRRAREVLVITRQDFDLPGKDLSRAAAVLTDHFTELLRRGVLSRAVAEAILNVGHTALDAVAVDHDQPAPQARAGSAGEQSSRPVDEDLLGGFGVGVVVGSFNESSGLEDCSGADERDQVRAVHGAPAVLGGFDEFERHREPGGA